MTHKPSAAAKVRACALAGGMALMATVAVGGPQPCGQSMANPVPEVWVTVGIGQAFCLSLPPTLRRRPMRSKDSLSGEFEGAGMQLMFDYGAYSSPLTEFANEAPRIEAITVDGQKAKLVSTAGMTAVHVPATGARQALTVIVRYSDEGVQPQALQIVRAIRFTTTN